jgi:hypothetical protein
MVVFIPRSEEFTMTAVFMMMRLMSDLFKGLVKDGSPEALAKAQQVMMVAFYLYEGELYREIGTLKANYHKRSSFGAWAKYSECLNIEDDQEAFDTWMSGIEE